MKYANWTVVDSQGHFVHVRCDCGYLAGYAAILTDGAESATVPALQSDVAAMSASHRSRVSTQMHGSSQRSRRHHVGRRLLASPFAAAAASF